MALQQLSYRVGVIILVCLITIIQCKNDLSSEQDNDNDSIEAEESVGSSSSYAPGSTGRQPILVEKKPSKSYSYDFGMNLDFFASWSTQIIFVDVMKQSKYWEGYQIGTEVKMVPLKDLNMTTDGKGYPTSPIPFDHDNNPTTGAYTVATNIFFGQAGYYPKGDYTLRFKGTGKIFMEWDAGRNPEKGYGATPRIFSGTGDLVTYTVPVLPNIGIAIQITESDADDPIRDIELIIPGYADSAENNAYHPFYPPFIEKLAGFSVIRPMNLLLTNGIQCDDPTQVPTEASAYKKCRLDWENRVAANYCTHTVPGRGMPYESVIDIVNAVEGSDLWINIPHAASDDYIEKLAVLIKTRLKSERNVYIEWSNEIWNADLQSFPQFLWYQENGLDAFPTETRVVAASKYFVRGLFNIFHIFNRVFTGQTDRLVKVLNTHVGMADHTINLLNYVDDSSLNFHNETFDAIAIASYFGWSLLPFENGRYIEPTSSELLAAARAHIQDIPNVLQGHKKALEAYKLRNGITRDLPILAYEGGAHITPMDKNWAYIGLGTNADKIDWTAYYEANSSPEIYDLYLQWAETWYASGGGLMLAFSYVSVFPGIYTTLAGEDVNMGTGVFGHLERLDTPTDYAYKYKALRDLMGQ